jgi:hypothetical protein
MAVSTLVINRFKAALENQKTETARRLGAKALSENPSNELVRFLHQTYRRLSDYSACQAVLENFPPRNESEKFELLLLQAEDCHVLSSYEFYRTSEEGNAGLSGHEYAAKHQARSVEFFRSALVLADADPNRRHVLAQTLERTGSRRLAREWDLVANNPAVASPRSVPTVGSGTISGRLKFPDGKAVTDATITLDSLAFDISTRLLAQGVTVPDDDKIQLDFVVDEWKSAPSETPPINL